jgi:hypothetical protein
VWWAVFAAIFVALIIGNEVWVARMSPAKRQEMIRKGWLRHEPAPLQQRLRRAAPFAFLVVVIVVGLAILNATAG